MRYEIWIAIFRMMLLYQLTRFATQKNSSKKSRNNNKRAKTFHPLSVRRNEVQTNIKKNQQNKRTTMITIENRK